MLRQLLAIGALTYHILVVSEHAQAGGIVVQNPETMPLGKSDTMVSHEIGVKSELMNRSASLDLDVFKITRADMQIATASVG